jgi:hypothetical protein
VLADRWGALEDRGLADLAVADRNPVSGSALIRVLAAAAASPEDRFMRLVRQAAEIFAGSSDRTNGQELVELLVGRLGGLSASSLPAIAGILESLAPLDLNLSAVVSGLESRVVAMTSADIGHVAGAVRDVCLLSIEGSETLPTRLVAGFVALSRVDPSTLGWLSDLPAARTGCARGDRRRASRGPGGRGATIAVGANQAATQLRALG